MRWKGGKNQTGWSPGFGRKWFCRTEYNFLQDPFPRYQFFSLKEVIKVFSSVWHLWTLQIRWVSPYPFLQVGKLRHKCWGRERSPAVLENESSGCVSWSTAQSIRLFLPVEEELCAAAVEVMHCCVCRFALLYSPSTQFSLWFQMFPLLLLSQTLSYMKSLYSPFYFLPSVSLLPLIIQTLFWFIKMIYKVSQRCSEDPAWAEMFLCVSVTQMQNYRSSGSDQVQVITGSLERLHFEILSHVFLGC